MFVYLFLEAIKIVHGAKWSWLNSGWGAWYGVEILGFTALPMVLLLAAASRRNLTLAKWGSALTLVGIVLNRMNVSVIAFKWYAPVHYVPSWMEVVVSAGVICAELWVFRWVASRMPVFGYQPAWARPQQQEWTPRTAAA
jgi:Ni/Fe-hydrogenase subunit HybB-like protein